MNITAWNPADRSGIGAEHRHRRNWRLAPWMLQLVALVPVMIWFVRRLDDGNDEPLGLLTLALALGLIWRDRKSLHAGPFAAITGAALILISVLGIPFLPPLVRAGIALAGTAVVHGVHRQAGLSGLLFLSLPVAASMQFFLGYPLRIAAAEGTVRLLELGSLVISRSGTQVELAGQVIGVDPACGGVRMLWHALAAAMALAAIHRLSWRATVIGGLFAIGLVIPANTLRAALLVVQETGHLPGFLLGHGAVGSLAFAVVLVPLWLAISSRARPPSPAVQTAPAGRPAIILAGIAALLVPLQMIYASQVPPVAGPVPVAVVFTFNGMVLPLHPLPATAEETAFARSFPGTLSSHRWGDRQVILRQVTVATRRLHPSRDCLRAAGFETTEAITVTLGDGTRWARFHATRDGFHRTVHERIISTRDDSCWTDVSAWYWSALGRPLNGPWQAETVIGE